MSNVGMRDPSSVVGEIDESLAYSSPRAQALKLKPNGNCKQNLIDSYQGLVDFKLESALCPQLFSGNVEYLVSKSILTSQERNLLQQLNSRNCRSLIDKVTETQTFEEAIREVLVKGLYQTKTLAGRALSSNSTFVARVQSVVTDLKKILNFNIELEKRIQQNPFLLNDNILLRVNSVVNNKCGAGESLSELLNLSESFSSLNEFILNNKQKVQFEQFQELFTQQVLNTSKYF